MTRIALVPDHSRVALEREVARWARRGWVVVAEAATPLGYELALEPAND